MKISRQSFVKICRIMALENKITKSMASFGMPGQITFSDITREIRKRPKLLFLFKKGVEVLS